MKNELINNLKLIDNIDIINKLGIPIMLIPTISYVNNSGINTGLNADMPKVVYTLTLRKSDLDDDGKYNDNDNIYLRVRGDQVRIHTLIKSSVGNVDVFKPTFGHTYDAKITVDHYKNPARLTEN